MMAETSLYRLVYCLLMWIELSDSSRTRRYHFPGSQCSRGAREVDAVQLLSSTSALYANSGCVMKFRADGSGIFNTAQFFIYFESFSITDCQTTLKIYYSSSSSGVPDVTLGCNSRPTTLRSSSRYVTLRLDKRSTTGYHFIITMTATKSSCGYKDFSCRDNTTGMNYCFDDDVKCDRAYNCPDHRDEVYCSGLTTYRRRMGTGSVLGSVVSLLFFVAIIAFCVFMVRRRRRLQAAAGTQLTVIHTSERPQPTHLSQPPYPNYPQTQMAGAPPGYQTVPPPPGPQYAQYPPPQPYPGYPPQGPPHGAPPAYPPAYPPGAQYPPPPPGVAYNAASQQVNL